MSEAQIVITALVLLGSVMHVYCAASLLKIAQNQIQRKTRNQLVGLTLLAGFISILYIVFALFGTHADNIGMVLLVSTILFLAAVLVLIICRILIGTFGVMQNIELTEKQRISDESMGIYNRVYFDLRLQEAYALARRHGQNFSVLLLEIDYLDRISRSHGGEYTEKFLASLGELIRISVRETDIVARHSREEMAILLPNTDLDGAKTVVRKVRAGVENKAFYLDDTGEINQVMVACTVSIGVASCVPEIKTADEIMRRADVALFKAKDKGRNQAAVYGE